MVLRYFAESGHVPVISTSAILKWSKVKDLTNVTAFSYTLPSPSQIYENYSVDVILTTFATAHSRLLNVLSICYLYGWSSRFAVELLLNLLKDSRRILVERPQKILDC